MRRIGPVAGTALGIKPNNLAVMTAHHPDGDLVWKIANGRGPMPRWSGMLSEAQIWDVVNYLKSAFRP